jgi:anti-sigma factor RsiW
MNEEHILKWLERGPLSALSAAERAALHAHTARCDACRQSYAAARLAERLCQARAAETLEPPPFFQTRVLAALRAQQPAGVELTPFTRFWRAARGLVAAMGLAVVLLLALSWASDEPAELLAADTFALETVVTQEAEQAVWSDEQVLDALYTGEEFSGGTQ